MTKGGGLPGALFGSEEEPSYGVLPVIITPGGNTARPVSAWKGSQVTLPSQTWVITPPQSVISCQQGRPGAIHDVSLPSFFPSCLHISCSYLAIHLSPRQQHCPGNRSVDKHTTVYSVSIDQWKRSDVSGKALGLFWLGP